MVRLPHFVGGPRPIVLLEPFRPRHLAAFARIRSAPTSGMFLRHGPLDMRGALAHGQRLLADSDRSRDAGGLGLWAVVEAGRERCAGFVGASDADFEDALSVFYMIDPAVRRCGYATLALRGIVDLWQRSGDRRPLVAVSRVENTASHAVALRCEFALAGRRLENGVPCWEFQRGPRAQGPEPSRTRPSSPPASER